MDVSSTLPMPVALISTLSTPITLPLFAGKGLKVLNASCWFVTCDVVAKLANQSHQRKISPVIGSIVVVNAISGSSGPSSCGSLVIVFTWFLLVLLFPSLFCSSTTHFLFKQSFTAWLNLPHLLHLVLPLWKQSFVTWFQRPHVAKEFSGELLVELLGPPYSWQKSIL